MALPMNPARKPSRPPSRPPASGDTRSREFPKDKAEIIVCANNFHGRTVTIVSFSTDDQYRDGFGPFTPGFKVIPFGDARPCARRSRRTPARFWWNPSRAKLES